MDLQTLTGHWQATLDAVQRLGGKASRLSVEPPATESAVASAESSLGHPLPASLKAFFLTGSRRVRFTWSLPDSFPLPDGFIPGVFGAAHLSLAALADAEHRRREIVDYLQSIDYSPERRAAFSGKLAFCLMANSDLLAIDLSAPGQEPVVYVEHQDDEMQGYRIAEDFQDFLTRWSALGCPGPEWWQWLHFVGEDGRLDPECANARLWKRALGLKP